MQRGRHDVCAACLCVGGCLCLRARARARARVYRQGDDGAEAAQGAQPLDAPHRPAAHRQRVVQLPPQHYMSDLQHYMSNFSWSSAAAHRQRVVQLPPTANVSLDQCAVFRPMCGLRCFASGGRPGAADGQCAGFNLCFRRSSCRRGRCMGGPRRFACDSRTSPQLLMYGPKKL